MEDKPAKSLIIREDLPTEARVAEIDGSVRDPYVQHAVLADIAEGATVLEAAARAQVSVAALYRERRRDAEFAERWSDAMEIRRLARVEAADTALWERGTEGVTRGIWYQGEQVAEEQVYDTTAARTWLAANDDRYQARARVDARVQHSLDWTSVLARLDSGGENPTDEETGN